MLSAARGRAACVRQGRRATCQPVLALARRVDAGSPPRLGKSASVQNNAVHKTNTVNWVMGSMDGLCPASAGLPLDAAEYRLATIVALPSAGRLARCDPAASMLASDSVDEAAGKLAWHTTRRGASGTQRSIDELEALQLAVRSSPADDPALFVFDQGASTSSCPNPAEQASLQADTAAADKLCKLEEQLAQAKAALAKERADHEESKRQEAFYRSTCIKAKRQLAAEAAWRKDKQAKMIAYRDMMRTNVPIIIAANQAELRAQREALKADFQRQLAGLNSEINAGLLKTADLAAEILDMKAQLAAKDERLVELEAQLQRLVELEAQLQQSVVANAILQQKLMRANHMVRELSARTYLQ